MNLVSLRSLVVRRLKTLDELGETIRKLSYAHFDREKYAAFSVIELLSLSAEWVRHYYLGVSMNEAIRKDGRRIIIGRKHRTVEDAIIYAISNSRGQEARQQWLRDRSRFFEPSWASESTLPHLAKILNFPQHASISASFIAASKAYRTMRITRNYFAHRNVDSWQQFRSAAQAQIAFGNLHASEIIFNVPLQGYNNLFAAWIDAVDIVSNDVCDY